MARNRALDLVLANGAIYTVFIDDDTASPEWLETHYSLIERENMGTVQNQVVSVLPDGKVPGWDHKTKRKEAGRQLIDGYRQGNFCNCTPPITRLPP